MPQDVADCFSLIQIDAKITSILANIEMAEASVKDVFGDMQANQSTQRQEIDKLYETLAVWVKAKNILNGTDSSTAELISVNYNPTWQRI